MKVKVSSLLRSSHSRLKWLEEGQIVGQAGNNLFISELGKPPSDFVPLNKNNSHLYDFAATPNRRALLTVELNETNQRI